MSELYIAEKKDIADAIASYIWPDGQFEKKLPGKGNGYYQKGDTVISWAKGHVLTRTLDITEKLYMDKLVSYPRSDCKYLPEAQLADASGILDKLTAIGIKGAAGANPDLKSPAWNDNKISAHHAIIPTSVAPKDLKEDEAAVYRLICERYVLQFYPDCQYETTKFSLNISDETFTGSGKIILFPGYTSLLRKDVTEDIENNENIRLPNLSQGENLGVPQNVDLQAKETKPPKRFTEVSLLDAMINIYRFMDKG